MKKTALICLIIVTMIFSTIQFGALAEENITIYDSIDTYITANRAGACFNFTVNAVADSEVMIVIYKDGGKLPLPDDDTSFKSNIAYIDQITANGDGIAKFKFKSVQTSGNYTVSLEGSLYSASHTERYNEPEGTIGKKDIFLVEWQNSGLETTDTYVTSVGVSKDDIDRLGVDETARKVKADLDNEDAGKRVLFLHNDLGALIYSEPEDIIWCDEGAETLRSYMDDFFDAFYKIGGDVDYIYSDFEFGFSNWHLENRFGNDTSGREKIAEALMQVQSNSNYAEKLRPILEDREFPFYSQNGVTELYYVSNWRLNDKAYVIWNAAMTNMVNEYIDYAVYEAAKVNYPNVKYSNYLGEDTVGWDIYVDGVHRNYLGGNLEKPGTHAAPPMYGKLNSETSLLDINLNTITRVSNNSFKTLLKTVNHLRRADMQNDSISPWISSYTADAVFAGSPYWAELFIHTAFSDPDPILFFGPRYYSTDAAEDVQLNYNCALSLLEEVNEVLGFEDRQTIELPLMSYERDYILSGMYANGYNIWRITPDISIDGFTLDGFLEKSDETGVTFEIDGQKVYFPGGEIYVPEAGSLAEHAGYYVITDKNVVPEESISDSSLLGGEFTATLKLFNASNGKETASFDNLNDYVLIVRYDNEKNNPQQFVVMQCTYEDNKLNSLHVLGEEKVVEGLDGQRNYQTVKVDGSFDTVKFMLWENTDTCVPLTEAWFATIKE